MATPVVGILYAATEQSDDIGRPKKVALQNVVHSTPLGSRNTPWADTGAAHKQAAVDISVVHLNCGSRIPFKSITERMHNQRNQGVYPKFSNVRPWVKIIIRFNKNLHVFKIPQGYQIYALHVNTHPALQYTKGSRYLLHRW